MTGRERIEYDREVARLRGDMDEPAFAAHWDDGRALAADDLERVVAEALCD